jgi:hypothetical protein
MIEVKTPAGELSDPQQSASATVLARGGRIGVMRSADEMLGLSRCMGHTASKASDTRGSVAA